MGRDSTESGEDSDLVVSAQPKDSAGKSNAAANIDENCKDARGGGVAQIYSCLYPGCDASFKQISRFTSHQFVHAGIRPFSCEEEGCDKTYTSFPHVNRHSQTNHNKNLIYHEYMKKQYFKESVDTGECEKRYKCAHPNCSAVFLRPNKLRAHQRTHTNERPYICTAEGCIKSYTNPSHLKRHVQSVHSPKPIDITYKCTFKGCELVFKTNQTLKKHYKRKHEGLDYKCTECEAMFKKRRQLTLHLSQHNGTPGFSCLKCDKKFEAEYHLKRHEQRGHKVYKCSVENCSEGPFNLWTLYRKHMALKHRPDFTCDICQQSFPFMFRLQMHKESHHTDSVANPWHCSYPNCSLTFKEKRNMSQHVRRVHEGMCFQCPQEDCGKKFHWKASLDRHVRLHTVSRPLPRPRKKTKKRKDCGKPKKSIATKLTNIDVPSEIEKEILSKDTVDSEDDILISESGNIMLNKRVCFDTSSATDIEGAAGDSDSATDVEGTAKTSKRLCIDTSSATDIDGTAGVSDSATDVKGTAKMNKRPRFDTSSATDIEGAAGVSDSATDVEGTAKISKRLCIDTSSATDIEGAAGMSDSATDLEGTAKMRKRLCIDTSSSTDIDGAAGVSEGIAKMSKRLHVDSCSATDLESIAKVSDSVTDVEGADKVIKGIVDTRSATDIEGAAIMSDSATNVEGAAKVSDSDGCTT